MRKIGLPFISKSYTPFFILLIAVLFNCAIRAQDNLIFIDDFSYPLGSLIGNDGWLQLDGTKIPAIEVSSPGLIYPNYVGSNIGYAVTLGNNGQDGYAHFFNLHGNNQSVTSGSLYVAAMVMVTTAQATGDYFLYLDNNGAGKATCGVYVQQDGDGFDFGLCKSPTDKNPSSPIVWSSKYILNTTHLIVLKYTFNTNSSTDDQCDFYIDPVLPLDPCVLTSPLLTTTDGKDAKTGIDAIFLRQGDASIAPTLVVDGIRVGLSCLDIPLPVELSSFTSTVNGRDIQLNWSTKTEKNSDKFVIERMGSTGWTEVGSVKASVLSNSPKQYFYTDKNLQSDKYQYRLKMIDNDGSLQYSPVVETEVALPKEFTLSQNYPNPFNPSTKINYSLPSDSRVTLEIFNLLGVRVGRLVNQDQSAGYYSVDFNSSSLSKSISSGVYMYRIIAKDKATGNYLSSIKKMMLLK